MRVSGADEVGEGEHKIVAHIRAHVRDAPASAETHCICGKDGDLIFLGLGLPTPHVVLFRCGFGTARTTRGADRTYPRGRPHYARGRPHYPRGRPHYPRGRQDYL